MKTEIMSGLEILRKPFELHQISKLPKPTAAQTEEVRSNFKAGIRCDICGGWHHPKVVHLDYVGHAALTDRLLEADQSWNWEPVVIDETGSPKLDKDGGMWIRLTVCGVTRLGYGDAQGKTGGNAVKERIGDALRNAAMRFGAALELWHKGVLHMDDEIQEIAKPDPLPVMITSMFEDIFNAIAVSNTVQEIGILLKSAVKGGWPKDKLEVLQKQATQRKQELTKE